MQKKYLIIPAFEIPNINFDEIGAGSAEELRLSLDEQWAVIRYNADQRPSVFSTDYNEYTHSEILTIMHTKEWSPPIVSPEDEIIENDVPL
jgi:hypothetical protein